MSGRRLWATGAFVLGLLLAGGTLAFAGGILGGGDDTPVLRAGAEPPEEAIEEVLARDAWFMSRRTAGDIPLDNQQAGAFRAAAARQAARLRKEGTPASGPATFNGSWTAIGPNPIVQNTVYSGGAHFAAMAGRIGALAIRPSTGT